MIIESFYRIEIHTRVLQQAYLLMGTDIDVYSCIPAVRIYHAKGPAWPADGYTQLLKILYNFNLLFAQSACIYSKKINLLR